MPTHFSGFREILSKKLDSYKTFFIIFNLNPNIKRFSELKNMQTIWIDSYSGHRPYFIKETDEKYYWNMKHKVTVGEIFFSKKER